MHLSGYAHSNYHEEIAYERYESSGDIKKNEYGSDWVNLGEINVRVGEITVTNSVHHVRNVIVWLCCATDVECPFRRRVIDIVQVFKTSVHDVC